MEIMCFMGEIMLNFLNAFLCDQIVINFENVARNLASYSDRKLRT